MIPPELTFGKGKRILNRYPTGQMRRNSMIGQHNTDEKTLAYINLFAVLGTLENLCKIDDEAKAINPYLETLPYVGLKPDMPQKLAGSLILPPVSEPSETQASSAATEAADPPEEPPGTLFKL